MVAPRVSLIINGDTRKGWLDDFTGVKNDGGNSLFGCRSVDFLIEGVLNKRKFLAGCELETILFIDEREPITREVRETLNAMLASGVLTKLVIETANHGDHRWNDRLYIRTLRHTTFDYVAHFDGDAAAFRRDDFPLIEKYLAYLDDGASYVCQQTPLAEAEHGMWWASTRFFFCKRETLDLDEVQRCLNDEYRVNKYGAKHCPCLEHILALIANGPAIYPPSDNENFVVVNWVNYFRSVLGKLNSSDYDRIYDYIFNHCGGVHGASDLIGVPWPY